MSSVKRRLVYIADENETLLNELSGTPPTRPTRSSHLLVSPSPLGSDVGAPEDGTVNSTRHQHSEVDERLLVSFDGFLLTDGSGRLFVPPSSAQAVQLRISLMACHKYLKQFVGEDAYFSSSSDSYGFSTASSCCDDDSCDATEEVEEEDEDDDFSENARRKAALRRRARHATTPTVRRSKLASLTVAQLRDILRDHDLPLGGKKEELLRRIELISSAAKSESTSCSEPHHEVLHSIAEAPHSQVSKSSLVSDAPSSQLHSPISLSSTESQSFWGAIANVGSRIFHSTTRSSLSFLSPKQGSSESPPEKRRRTA